MARRSLLGSLIGGAVCLLIFLVTTILVFSQITQGADAELALAINHTASSASFTALMVFFSDYGREYFWIPIVAAMLLLGNRDTKLLAIELGALFVAGIVAGEILKFVAYRARPYEVVSGIVRRLPIDTDSSFPSGHALIVSIGATFAVARFRYRVVSLLLVVEAALVCYSRIYTGMHYPLDVVGGVFLGIGIVGVGLFVLERYAEPLLKRFAAAAVTVLRDGPLRLGYEDRTHAE